MKQRIQHLETDVVSLLLKTMKKILRILFIGLFLFFAWPFFLYRRYGNLAYRPSGNTIIVSNHYSTFDAFFI